MQVIAVVRPQRWMDRRVARNRAAFGKRFAWGDRSKSMSKAQERKAAYNSVIQDLYAKRAQLDQAIEALEVLLSTEAPAARTMAQGSPLALAGEEPDGAPSSESIESGGSLIGAIKAVLRRSERPLANAEIFKQLKAAGIRFRSANPQLSVSQVLSRNSRLFGEPVRVGRGRWAMR
jgi:hypothetical protein